MRNTWRIGIALTLLTVVALSCTPNGRKPVTPSVFIVPSDRNVTLIDPNVAVMARQPSVLLSRGYYLELVRLEMQVRSGSLVPAK